jgi:hypothetical protein
MRDELDQLVLADALLESLLQMEGQLVSQRCSRAVDAPPSLDGGLHCSLDMLRARHVEARRPEVVRGTQRLAYALRLASVVTTLLLAASATLAISAPIPRVARVMNQTCRSLVFISPFFLRVFLTCTVMRPVEGNSRTLYGAISEALL